MKLEISRESSAGNRLLRARVRHFQNARRRTGWITASRAIPSLALTFMLAGCGAISSPSIRCPDDPVAANSAQGNPDFSPYNRFPKFRIGSLPCPGPLTLFATADPEHLGPHSYGTATMVGKKEVARGIIYTLHGGFIDIAHVRKTTDWTAHHHARFLFALEHGWNCIRLPSEEESEFQIRLNYPENWRILLAPRRQQVINELSIRLAQRLAIIQSEWHEIATGFGYSSTPYPEKPSTFTYDDMTSHLLGAKIAGLALRDTGSSFDAAATYHLKRELDHLGAVSPEQTFRALDMVKNNWWHNGFVIKRQFDVGEKDGLIEPWIVPGFPDGKTEQGIPFSIPSLGDVAGMNLSGFERVEIIPQLGAWSSMRRVLPGNPQFCYPEEHFPLLMR